jgi:hypothetical protein
MYYMSPLLYQQFWETCCLSDDRGSIFLWNVGELLLNYTTSHVIRRKSLSVTGRHFKQCSYFMQHMVKTTNLPDILHGCTSYVVRRGKTVKYECQKTKWLGPKTKLRTQIMILHNKEIRRLCRSHGTYRKRSTDGFGNVDFNLRQVEK